MITLKIRMLILLGMERHAVLANLNNGLLPANFSEVCGDATGELEGCIREMVQQDAARRFTCAEVRTRLENLLN